ncbi:MAG TPA: amino acid adenylation domain-containing protein [Candidatus Angelobacter sp.]
MSPAKAVLKKDNLEEERELLRRLLEKEGLGSSDAGMTHAVAHERLPLSYGQRRMWFLDRLQPGSDFYNVVLVFDLLGELNVPALERSLQEIARRHGALRTRFVVENGEPVQRIEPAIKFPLRVVDVRHGEGRGDRKKQAEEIVSEEGAKPFDLAQGPLWRGVLVLLGDRKQILGLSIHHIVFDEWSMGVLQHELGLLYAAYVQGQESPLKKMPVQYADYTLWQGEWLKGEVYARQMEYWKKQLAGMPGVLELPTDKPRPAVPQRRNRMESRAVGRELWEGLKRVSRQEGATLFMTLLAAYEVLLLRYTGQADFGVGTPVADRSHLQTEGVIGFCVNTLVMRAELEGESSFREVLKRVRRVALDGFAHQELPFEKLVEELSPERRLSHMPLFQVIFTLRNELTSRSEFGGLQFSMVRAEAGTLCDLVFTAAEYEKPTLEFHYAADLFEAATMERMLGHGERILEGVVANAGQRIWELPLLSEQETKQLARWNQTRRDYPREKTIAELFEEQAERHEEEMAAVFGTEQLKYAELNRRSNQLGHYLRKLGVGPETLVGISMERSLEMIVGTLGILKAGGAYVPLDPAYPQERLQYMVEDAGLEVVLTQECLAVQLPQMKARVVYLDRDWNAIGQCSAQTVESGAAAGNLAYVMYTSGSTGRPKGMGITQRNVVRLVCKSDYLELRGSEVIAQAANSSFDAATFEIWGALLNGGRVVGISSEVLLDARKLKAEILGQGVQIMFLTTSLFNGFAKQNPETFDSMQHLLFGGETANAEAVAAFLKHNSSARLMNVYGPVEGTTLSTWYVVRRADREKANIPIGRPLANSQVYVLDPEMNLSPVGVVGELCIGGEGLGRAYWRRPEMTAEKFIPNPYSEAGGERLYRTGDRARWLPDGNIEFLGRMDTQVKIRGFRVELGEIESTLRQQSGVRDCVVMAKPGVDGSKRLVAYVAGDREGEDLRRDLKRKLPEYMVPSLIVKLTELPLTANGKVDRHALLEVAQPEIAGHYVAPRTAVEEQLARIWAEVLEVIRTGIHDNFFDLGGHSLLATLMVTRMQNAFGVEVPVRAVFESPTIAQLGEVIEAGFRDEELCGKKLPGGDQAEISARERSRPRPSLFQLSYPQEQLWFLDRLQPGSDFYNVALAWELKGELDVATLERSLREVMRRHEILRTCFVLAENEEPRQKVVEEELDLHLALVDLTDLEDSEKQIQARKVLAEEGAKPFDLGHAPLLRGVVVRMGEREHILGLTLHHIVCDHWSFGVLWRELGVLYEAYGKGEESPLPELPAQYADYALEQREGLQGEKYAQQMEYWKKQLAGMPEVLKLPTDRPRPAAQSFRGRIERRKVGGELLAGLNGVGRRENASLFMTLMAAYQVLLMRYTGQEDFGVGTAVANRNRAETEGLIGFFLNTLVMRANLSGAPTFREVLRRVRDAALSGYANQNLPFERLVEELAPERDLSRSPVFQVMFTLRKASMSKSDFGGLELNPVEVEVSSSKCDLVLLVEERPQELIMSLNYSTDLFVAEMVRRMLGHYERLLAAAVAGPENRIQDMAMLTENESQQILVEWNQTRTEYPRNKTMMELFAEQVRRRGEELAVVCGKEQLSYIELDRRSNQLGRYLRKLGVGRDKLVGISVERSVEMVLGMVGILKAGGAYVPIDPAYPQERLRFMVEDSDIGVLLTQKRLAHRLSAMEAPVVCLDGDWEEIGQQSDQDLAEEVEPENLAYVIYTSGSTGQPKGVAVTQRSMVRLLRDTNYIHFQGDEVVAQTANMSFDPATFEIWGALLNGCRLVIIVNEVLLDVNKFEAEIEHQGVQVMFLATALFNEVAKQNPAIFNSVKYLLFGGEAVHPGAAAAVLAHGAPECLMNAYGPAECTTFSTWYVVREVAKDATSVPIGQPVANTQAYVLDREMNLVPVGVMGELYIGGEGVARGYWERPELTGERFLPNPHGQSGERMYCSGDLARWMPDGKLEFFGRADNQIKIRGFRVELGEIETALRQHGGVRDCAVVMKIVGSGQQLVAYVCGEVNADQLKNCLKAELPEYMVPSDYVKLAELPLNTNGKVDRMALQEAKVARPERTAEQHVAPRTAVEDLLAEIWAELLGITRTGVHDDFFDLGGHSLLATLMVARMRNAFGIDVPVRVVFESSTIAQLAEVIEAGLRGEELPGKKPAWADNDQGIRLEASKPMRATSGPRPSLFPLSYPQEQLWFLDRLQPNSDFYNVPLAWELKGDLDVPTLIRSLQEVMRRHEILRTCFVLGEDGEPRQKVVEDRLDLRLPLVDLRDLEGNERKTQARKILAEEGGRPFDLGHDPLLRGVVVRMGEREHILGLTLHHIVCDDWSFGVLWQELGALYEAYGKGEQSPLKELPAQYEDYALWQREMLRGEKLEQQMQYWKRQLAGMPEVLELQTDRARPATPSFRGRIERRMLGADLVKSLNALGRRESATLFMTLLAAYQVLLMRYTGQEDFAIGTVLANRRHMETEGLIGFFMNTLVVRANLRGKIGFRELLRRVRESALGAYAHQDLPFEKLVEELAPDRDVSRTPLFQVMFTMRGAPTYGLELGALEVSEIGVDLDTSKCDLVMLVEEARQGATVSLNYSTDLFEGESIRRMLEQYERLLEGIVVDAEQQIWALPMMGESGEKVVPARTCASHASLPETNIIEIFEAQAESRPQEPAVVFGQVQLSCAELNRRANQVGHYLRHLGVAQESLVGIFMPPSHEMVAAILGILKAGGAYVPLDVLNPRERLQSIIDTAGITILLTLEDLRKGLPETGVRAVCLDSDWQWIAQQSAANLKAASDPHSLACVIYTSTKGMMIEQSGLMNFVSRHADHGSGVADSGWPGIWPHLTSSSFLVATSALVTMVAEGSRTIVRPGGNAEIYVLDPQLQRVAIGVPGELWIGGPGLARGYARQPSLTAAKFLPDSFVLEAGARMWWSGERARYREDGAIELLGRLDDQVEIEGFRVELGEIEAILASHKSVQQAAVVTRSDGNGSGPPVAYVVTHEGRRLDQNELRAYLDGKLLPFMMPKVFITLQELPRNSRGEVNRAALSALGEERVTGQYVPPRTELEQMIAASWQEVLGLDQVGVHDNFFDRGGHSLLIMRLHQKLRAVLSLDIELLHLLQFPTIDSLSRFLQAGYNFSGKSQGTLERAGRQKTAVQKLRKMHTARTEAHLTE